MNLQELRTRKENIKWELENGLLSQDSFKKDFAKAKKQLKQALEVEIQELRAKIKTSMFLTAREDAQLSQLKAELVSLKKALK